MSSLYNEVIPTMPVSSCVCNSLWNESVLVNVDRYTTCAGRAKNCPITLLLRLHCPLPDGFRSHITATENGAKSEPAHADSEAPELQPGTQAPVAPTNGQSRSSSESNGSAGKQCCPQETSSSKHVRMCFERYRAVQEWSSSVVRKRADAIAARQKCET